MERFHILLEKYLADNASAPEQEELMQMIRSGVYDTVLKQKIDFALKQETPATDMPAENRLILLHKIFHTEQQATRLAPLVRSPSRIRKRVLSAAAVIIVLVASGWWLLAQHGPQQRITAAKHPGETTLVEKHGRQFIHLPDGSTVLLNEKSQLSYPKSFTGKTREVTLTGEGYFDIRHNAGKRFIVHAGNINVIVLGTAFNIRAYPAQENITVTVTRGKVQVSDRKKDYGIATPDQQIAVNTKDNVAVRKEVNAEKTIAWKQQYLIIDNLSMEDAALLIGHQYHVNVLLADEDLKRYRISATFLNNENLEQVLTVVCGVINATYTLQPNDQVIINRKTDNTY